MFEFVYQWVKDNIRREEGQAMAEYGVILALIAAICILAIGLLGTQVNNAFNAVVTAITP